MDTVTVGWDEVDVRPLATHLFLNEAERMPPDAPDEWFLPRPCDSGDYRERVITFLRAMDSLVVTLWDLPEGTSEKDIQYHFYETAKVHYGEDRAAIREFFRLGYFFLLNSWSGPRWGQFVVIQGIPGFIAMVEDRLANPLLAPLNL